MAAIAVYQQIDPETLDRIRKSPRLVEGIVSPEGYAHADGVYHVEPDGNIAVDVDRLGMSCWQDVDRCLPSRVGAVVMRKGAVIPAAEIQLSEEAVSWKDPATGKAETCPHSRIARLSLEPLPRQRLQDARRGSHISKETVAAFGLFLGLVYLAAHKILVDSQVALESALVLLGLALAASLALALRAFLTSRRYVDYTQQKLRRAAKQAVEPIDIDKAWESLEPALRALSPTEQGDAARAIGGGAEIGDDLGYGPARYLEPREVQDLASALGRVDQGALLASLGDETRGYAAGHFTRLKDYFGDAASNGAGMLLWRE